MTDLPQQLATIADGQGCADALLDLLLERGLPSSHGRSARQERRMRVQTNRVWGPRCKVRRRRPDLWELTIQEGGRRRWERYESREEAEREKARLQRRFEIPTVGEGLAGYVAAMRARGCKTRTIRTAMDRLLAWFPDESQSLADLRPAEAYVERREGLTKRGEPLSPTTADAELAAVKTWLRWCVGAGMLRKNPADDVKPLGGHGAGKEQLHLDEARRFSRACQDTIGAHRRGHEAALGLLLQLWLGLRSGEVCGLEVRDVDDGGRLLWVASRGGKTLAAKRTVEVPPDLVKLLDHQAAESIKRGSVWLFPATSGSGHRERTWLRKACARMCALASVPPVCPHGLRGTHATLARAAGATGHLVAQALGHEKERTTEQHYLAPGLSQALAALAVATRLGGRRAK